MELSEIRTLIDNRAEELIKSWGNREFVSYKRDIVKAIMIAMYNNVDEVLLLETSKNKSFMKLEKEIKKASDVYITVADTLNIFVYIDSGYCTITRTSDKYNEIYIDLNPDEMYIFQSMAVFVEYFQKIRNADNDVNLQRETLKILNKM